MENSDSNQSGYIYTKEDRDIIESETRRKTESTKHRKAIKKNVQRVGYILGTVPVTVVFIAGGITSIILIGTIFLGIPGGALAVSTLSLGYVWIELGKDLFKKKVKF